jgi:hypothetical protein
MKTEIDLHGLRVTEAVELFVKHYNSKVNGGDLSPVYVVHGYGSSGTGGTIKTALRNLFAANEDCLTFSQNSWNPGKTTVYPNKALPDGAGIVSAGIVEYCRTPRTESKILGKYRKFGDLRVKKTLKLLVKQRRLSTLQKGKHTVYTVPGKVKPTE